MDASGIRNFLPELLVGFLVPITQVLVSSLLVSSTLVFCLMDGGRVRQDVHKHSVEKGFQVALRAVGMQRVLVEGALDEGAAASQKRTHTLRGGRDALGDSVGGTGIQLLAPRPALIPAFSSLKNLLPGRVSYPIPSPWGGAWL